MKTRTLLAGVILLGVSGSLAATHESPGGSSQASCRVQGVWKLERMVTNGKADSTSIQHRKIMTKRHFMWTSQESRRDTLPLRTYRDSVRYFSDNGGFGTYRVSGSTLTERIEIFPLPIWIGRDFRATCRTTAKEWFHGYLSDPYTDSTGRSRRDTVMEVFSRVE